MTMKNIDQAAAYMANCIKSDPRYPGVDQLILEYAKKARHKCETLRTDDEVFDVWSNFVVAGEAVTGFQLIETAPATEPLLAVVLILSPLKSLLICKQSRKPRLMIANVGRYL